MTNKKILKYNTKNFNPLTETGFLMQKGVSQTAPLHTHEFFEIFLVTEGKALHLINDSVQNIERNDLVLIRPDDRHCYDFYQSYDFAIVNLAFTVEAIGKVSELFFPTNPLSDIISPPLSPVAHLSHEEAKFVYNELLSINSSKREVSPEYSKNYFKALLSFILMKFFATSIGNRSIIPKWLTEIYSQMHSIENFRLGLNCMLSMCYCSKEHFFREFKKYYNVTPTTFINNQRLGYSLYLLSNTELEIINVAEQCGFNSLSRFYHLFEKNFATSPRKFRITRELNKTIV